ncbi:MAG: thiamine pyrophosphate-requiring protein [Rhodobacteraceae bacterium]|nr:thiamine pyrophosphate-requiring protein [Paracoccaceae bacterium]
MTDDTPRPANGAEAVLLGLKSHGVDYLFANAGTDFPPVIEALASLPPGSAPEPLTIPHETASVGMAHGYWLATGRPQAVMVHVNVGLANAAMGVINAASDNVPVLVMSGRTPITETGRKGARMTPIQYGQEMYDQASLVSNVTKFHYEMRYPEQGEPLVSRALAVAKSAPEGPVYLSLPREPLSEAIPADRPLAPSARPAATPAHPDPAAIEEVAQLLAAAKHPLILCQRGDPSGALAARLSGFAAAHAIAVAEPFPVRNLMASSHPMFLGYDPKTAREGADVVVVLDADIPWIEALHAPPASTKIVHIGPDPHFTRMPVRGYRTDIAIQSDAGAAIEALSAAMPMPDDTTEARRAEISRRATARRDRVAGISEAGCEAPMSAEWMSRCIGEAMGEDGIVFSELGVQPGMMDLKGPNRVFSNPHSGGLGWAMTAALGAQLADRERLTIACIGDGSYIFANPVACHQIADALNLPLLTIIKNNGMWNAVRRSVVNGYPDGAAARLNTMPLTSLEPAPDYLAVAGASGAWTTRVEHGRDLPEALERAIQVIRTERRQALIDVRVAVSDSH